jgi:hypothetical protein
MVKPNKDYVKEFPNARAVSQTISWLKAVGVNVSVGNDCDICANDKNGAAVKINVSPSNFTNSDFVVSGPAISGKGSSSLEEFHALTQKLGFGSPIAVDRGVAPEHKLHYSDNFELVSFRHNEFRKAPNPTSEELNKYKQILKHSCHFFYRRNFKTCERNLIGEDDLMSYALVWTTTYLGLYKVQRETNNDNVRKLRAYLNQRFAEFAKMISKKERNVLPSSDTAEVCIWGQQLDSWTKKAGCAPEPVSDVGDEYKKKHSSINTQNTAVRKNSARQLLFNKLNSMDHDLMVSTLEETSKNNFICNASRLEAARVLRDHRTKCPKCKI